MAFTHRKEYARWVAEAKREETRQRRVQQALEMIRSGKTGADRWKPNGLIGANQVKGATNPGQTTSSGRTGHVEWSCEGRAWATQNLVEVPVRSRLPSTTRLRRGNTRTASPSTTSRGSAGGPGCSSSRSSWHWPVGECGGTTPLPPTPASASTAAQRVPQREAGDITGSRGSRTASATDVNVDYQAGAALHGFFGLYNRGPARSPSRRSRAAGLYYWSWNGRPRLQQLADRGRGQNYVPFRPSGSGRRDPLRRLDFHTATPAIRPLQDGSSRIVSLPVRYRILASPAPPRCPSTRFPRHPDRRICDHPL